MIVFIVLINIREHIETPLVRMFVPGGSHDPVCHQKTAMKSPVHTPVRYEPPNTVHRDPHRSPKVT